MGSVIQPDPGSPHSGCAGADRLSDAHVGGAILMSISTVVVALNAQLLRRLGLRPEASVEAVL
jgi:hypothetical protein